MMRPRFSFVNVHFTVSPAATTYVAVSVARFPDEFPSEHTIEVRSQKGRVWRFSVTVYEPGSTSSDSLSPSLRTASIAPEKTNPPCGGS